MNFLTKEQYAQSLGLQMMLLGLAFLFVAFFLMRWQE